MCVEEGFLGVFLCCVAAVRKLQHEFAAIFLQGWMLGSHVISELSM